MNGTSIKNPPYAFTSWLEYWEYQTGSKATICSRHNCWERDLVGGHVKKVDSGDDSHYIVPICKSCNHYNNTDPYYVSEELVKP